MTDLVTLVEAKAWLRVDADDEDALISLLISSASESVRTIANDWDGTGNVPSRLKLACLTRIAVAFDTRESACAGDGEDRLLQPFRVFEI